MQFGLNRSKLEGHGLYALAKCQHGTKFNKICDLYQTILTTEPIYHHSSCITNAIFFNAILWPQFTQSAAALVVSVSLGTGKIAPTVPIQFLFLYIREQVKLRTGFYTIIRKH